MPDPTNIMNEPQSATPTDSTAPVVPDPQKLVDEALAPSSPIPATQVPSTEPISAEALPTVKEEPKQEETVPAELLNSNNSVPTTEPAAISDSTPTTPTEVNIAPTIPEPASATTPMGEIKPSSPGEEVPLAFAGPIPNESVTTGPSSVPPTTDLPPVAPPASMTPPKPEKKKRKGGKILATILGFFLLLGGMSFGYWYYFVAEREIPTVAPVTPLSNGNCPSCDGGHKVKNKNGKCVWTSKPCDEGTGGEQNQNSGQANCNGCSPDGHPWVWRDGQCSKASKMCGQTSSGQWVAPSDSDEKNAPSNCGQAGVDGNTCCGAGYTYCGGKISKCVSHSALSVHNNSCNYYGQDVYDIPITYGSTPSKGVCSDQQKADGWTECPAGACGAGSGAYCFDRHGSCNSTIIARSDGTYVDTGLCGIVGSLSGNSLNSGFTEKSSLFCTQEDVTNKVGQCADVGVNGLKYDFDCDINGCSTKSGQCTIVHYTCKGSTTGNNSCTNLSSGYIGDKDNPPKGSSQNFDNKCGTIEQIDVMCGGYIESRTRKNAACDNNTNETTNNETPSLTCSTITKDVADANIKVGTAVKFTCAGTSTPAGAVNLTYKFQIQKDGGAWTDLTSTGATASYTVAATGAYQARCKACGTISNASVCDPDWTGATTQ